MNNFGQRTYDDWIFYYKGWSINQQSDEIDDINSVEKDSSGKKLVSTDANDTTKNDDVAESKATNSNTEEDDKFFDTSMNETSEFEVTTTKNDTEQNESTTNELEDNSNNGTNESDSESIIDMDDMNAGTST